MATYPVTLESEERYRVEGVVEGFFVSETVVRMHTRFNGTTRMKICYVTPEGKARRVTQGPIVDGPFAEFSPMATVIDNYGGTGAERQRLMQAGLEHDVENGDSLLIDGREYIIVDHRRSAYPDLVPVEEAAL